MPDVSNTPSVRVLPTQLANGAWQMAADEVMLERAMAGTASLRFYRWSEATLSLGYFQPESSRRTDPLLASLPFVRRCTGGAALVHDREITYALALPAGPPWQRRCENWLARMHTILMAALSRLGIAVHAVAAAESHKLGEVLCFLDQTAGDLLADGHKVVGSAQRKRQGALLQHGAILLSQSDHTPALPGLRELAGLHAGLHDRGGADLEKAVLESFKADTSWPLQEDNWSTADMERLEKLAVTRYSDPSWNCKR
jgi:lipoate-protein ligase A